MIINKEQFNGLPTNLQVWFHKKQDNLNGGAYSGGERSGGDWKDNSGFKNDKLEVFEQPQGRFPANLIHDNSEEVRECFPNARSSGIFNRDLTAKNNWNPTGNGCSDKMYSDSGSASRFFKSIIYQAKSSKSDRNSGGVVKNIHPTCKSTALMEYLIKMITPKGGIVLDPFMGSGSTGVAAKQNGYRFIGIEKEKEYVEIANKRLSATPNHLF